MPDVICVHWIAECLQLVLLERRQVKYVFASYVLFPKVKHSCLRCHSCFWQISRHCCICGNAQAILRAGTSSVCLVYIVVELFYNAFVSNHLAHCRHINWRGAMRLFNIAHVIRSPIVRLFSRPKRFLRFGIREWAAMTLRVLLVDAHLPHFLEHKSWRLWELLIVGAPIQGGWCVPACSGDGEIHNRS
jgi:hypothetical protein